MRSRAPAPVSGQRLPRDFYARDTVAVARDLLGQRLVRVIDGQRLSGLICETEAYCGPEDEASHAWRRTPRSAIMYGPPGRAYVYLIYGMYYCLNTVAEADGEPGAVLLRAIFPEEGSDVMQRLRSAATRAARRVSQEHLADGPGKLCQALRVTGALNGCDLSHGDGLFVEAAPPVPDQEVAATPRIGVRGSEETRRRPWRLVWQPTRAVGP